MLGDQLDHRSAAFDGFEPERDAVWMAENEREATHVWSHKLRLALFFSAMRHYRDESRVLGRTVHYHELGSDRSADRGSSFGEVLSKDIARLRPGALRLVETGDFRVAEELKEVAARAAVEIEIVPDRHFYCSTEAFRRYARTHPGLLLESFYRWMRMEHGILLDEDGEPEGGRWSFDAENRKSFGRTGPPRDAERSPRTFRHDATDEAVLTMVQRRFADHPGHLVALDVPRTRSQARALLDDFVRRRLSLFGPYEDAMWTNETFLFHSRLSTSLNLKLLDPRECVAAAVRAYRQGKAPIASVEGFVRQILGWRELVRGVYWLKMPRYAEGNALACDPKRGVPSFFWDGRTDMRCVAESMRSVLDHGYTHHIQRLMVLGLFAQLYGVHPRLFHEWHMAMYLDAIDWVSLPNALGMSQYGDGGIVGTKPYAASGKYIDRMSNYCASCPYDPARASGEGACPFTTFYWDFLDRHRERLATVGRFAYQLRSVEKKRRELPVIRERAHEIRERLDRGDRV